MNYFPNLSGLEYTSKKILVSSHKLHDTITSKLLSASIKLQLKLRYENVIW